MKNTLTKLFVVIPFLFLTADLIAQSASYNYLYLRANYDQLRFEVPGENRYFIMSKTVGTNDKAFALYAPEEGGYFTYWRQGSGDMIVNKGNIGIGVADPQEKLHINGSIRGNRNGGALRIQTTDGYIDIGPLNSSWAHIYTDRSKFIFNKSVYTMGGFSSYSSNDLALQTNAVTKLTIKNNTGNIGIGTTAPSARLQVKGQANDYSNKHFIVTDQYNNEDFVIRGSGQVEIGYDIDIPNSSLYKLAVGGGILAEEVKVQLKESWPDYVFDNTYQLTDLETLDAFIKANKHLPEIPSAAEVKAEGGIELGEMNRLLLQKIEELTLHAIRQEKLINKLSEKVEKLEKK